MNCPNDNSELYENGIGTFQCPKCLFNIPGNTKILENMYAWVSVDSEGREGFIAADLGNGVPMPLVHSEFAMAKRLKSIAFAAVKKIPGYRARLIKFSNSEILEQLDD